jgi:predicted PurR-regulated permease PerM
LLTLIYALYNVLKVFLGAFTFALIFSVSFAGPYERATRWLNGRRKLAAVLYSLVILIAVALPLIYLIATLGKHIGKVPLLVAEVNNHGLPSLPDQVQSFPLIGNTVYLFWEHLRDNPREALAGHELQVNMILDHVLTGGAGIIATGLQIFLGILISAFLLWGGEKVFRPLKSALQHLLGRRDGLTLLRATSSAIKGVSIGVMGTAFFVAIISWIGFAIAGIHFKLLLSALVFFMVLIQVGPLVVWIPLIIWMATQGNTGLAIFLGIYGGGMLLVESILKPVLIAKGGGKLPFLILFLGVIGGMAVWGFTGMFKGAIILAVAHTVFNSWLEKKKNAHLTGLHHHLREHP